MPRQVQIPRPSDPGYAVAPDGERFLVIKSYIGLKEIIVLSELESEKNNTSYDAEYAENLSSFFPDSISDRHLQASPCMHHVAY